MKQKLLASAMALAMVLSLTPVTALAAEDEANGQILVPASFARILDGEEDMGLYRFASVVTEEHGEGGTVTYALEGAQCTLLDDMLIGRHGA